MNQLISDENKMLLSIATLMSNNQHLSTNEISYHTSLSPRTIQRYLNKLDSKLSEYKVGVPKSVIELYKHQGTYFLNDPLNELVMFQNYIYRQDASIQLLLNLLFTKTESKKRYCEKHFISEGQLNNSLKKINSFITQFNLVVNISKFSLVGEESQIRLLAKMITWSLFESEKSPDIFSYISEHSIINDVEFLDTSLGLSLTEIEKKDLYFLISSSILRYRMGHTVKCNDEWNDYYPISYASSLSAITTKMMLNHHVVSHEEIKFLTINLLTRPYCYRSSVIHNELLLHLTKDTIVHRATSLFFERYQEYFPLIPPDIYDEAFLFIYKTHLHAHLYKNIATDYNFHYILENIYNNHYEWFVKIKNFIHSLLHYSNISLFESSEYLIQRYFVLLSTITPNLFLGPTINIYLKTDFSDIYEQQIKHILYDHIKYTFRINFINSNFFQKPDIILTNSLSEILTPQTIYFKYPLDGQDILDIEKKIAVIRDTCSRKSKI